MSFTLSLTALRLILASLGLAFVIGTVLALRFFSQTEGLTPFAQSYFQPGLGGVALQADGVRVVGHDRGRRRWRMTADTILFSRDRRTATVEGIRQGTLLDNHERPAVRVSAARAVYSSPFGGLDAPGTGILTLSGSVRAVVLSRDKTALGAETLAWDVPRGELSSPGPLSASFSRLRVTAGGGVYQAPLGGPDRGHLRLSGGVRAVVQSARGLTTLSCPGLVWDAQAHTARSLGPVSALIPGGLGTASALDVVVDTKTGSLQGHGFQGTLGVSAGP